MKTIGIIGGMGPGASGYLYNLINSLAVTEYGVLENHEFPETILYSIPVPDFISSNKQQSAALHMISKRIKGMNVLNPQVMGIACNTAHALLPDLQKVSQAPFVSMIDCVSEKVASTGIKKVGLLATSSTVRFKLYKKALEKKNIKIILPTILQQKQIDSVIQKILSQQVQKTEKVLLFDIADELVKKGAEGVILGCTELPLLFPKRFKKPIFNSVEILARALLRKSYGGGKCGRKSE